MDTSGLVVTGAVILVLYLIVCAISGNDDDSDKWGGYYDQGPRNY